MIYFAVRLLVYTLAAAVVLNVVPGLLARGTEAPAANLAPLLAYLVVGLVFGALHSFVRPIMLFFTGRLYIWSLGLVAMVVDVLIFLGLSYLSQEGWADPLRRLLTATAGAVLMGVLVSAMDAIVGFDSPRQPGDTRASPAYWRWLERLPGRERNRFAESLRTVQLISILRSYLVDIALGYTFIAPVRNFMKRALYRVRPRLVEADPAVKVRLMLQELGPTFVKFGQLVAGRIEVLPASWRTELEQLQDHVRPFTFAEASDVIERELKLPLAQAFGSFDPVPLAAASMGQVHAATLPDGTSVVVKVQRPNIDLLVRSDLNVLRDLIATLEARLGRVRRLGLSPLFDEFADMVVAELDFDNEAYQAEQLKHNMQEFPFVHVPAVFPEWSGRRVLTLERVTGVKITDISALGLSDRGRRALALRFFQALLQQVVFDGFFHADLHGGNVWYDRERRQIVFLDMGQVGQLSRADRVRLGQLIWALHDRAAGPTAQVLLALCQPHPLVDRPTLERNVRRLLNHHLVLRKANPDVGELLSELVTLLVRSGLRLRREFTLAFKAMGQGEAVMRSLMGDEGADEVVDIAFRTLRDIALKRLDPRRFAPEVVGPLTREALGRLPNLAGAALDLLDDFEHGRTAAQIDASSFSRRLASVERGFEHGFRRMVLSISLVGLMLASALVLVAPLTEIVEPTERIIIRLAAIVAVSISSASTVVVLAGVMLPRRNQDEG